MTERRHTKVIGEDVNTSVLKLVKTDKELVEELRAYVDAMIGKMGELRARGMVTTISLNNGATDGKVELQYFKVDKIMEEYKSEAVKAQIAQQQGGGR